MRSHSTLSDTARLRWWPGPETSHAGRLSPGLNRTVNRPSRAVVLYSNRNRQAEVGHSNCGMKSIADPGPRRLRMPSTGFPLTSSAMNSISVSLFHTIPLHPAGGSPRRSAKSPPVISFGRDLWDRVSDRTGSERFLPAKVEPGNDLFPIRIHGRLSLQDPPPTLRLLGHRCCRASRSKPAWGLLAAERNLFGRPLPTTAGNTL